MTTARKTNSPPHHADDAALHAEAERWRRRLAKRPLTADEARAFGAWIAAHPEHEQLLDIARVFDRALADVPSMRAYDEWVKPSLYERMAMAVDDVRSSAPRMFSKMRFWPATVGAAAIAISLTAIVVLPALNSHAPQRPEPQSIETRIAEIRDVRLPDGSVITIDAGSAVVVDYSQSERKLVLSRGGAFFSVARDTERPFIVVAANKRIRVLGTKFEVSLDTASVDVAVAEGRVEFSSTETVTAHEDESTHARILLAGQMATAQKSGGIGEVVAIDIDDVGAWRRGELTWAEAPLQDIIADLNRYADPGVVLEADGVADLEFTLGVRTDDIAGAVDLIAASLELEVERRPDGAFVLR